MGTILFPSPFWLKGMLGSLKLPLIRGGACQNFHRVSLLFSIFKNPTLF